MLPSRRFDPPCLQILFPIMFKFVWAGVQPLFNYTSGKVLKGFSLCIVNSRQWTRCDPPGRKSRFNIISRLSVQLLYSHGLKCGWRIRDMLWTKVVQDITRILVKVSRRVSMFRGDRSNRCHIPSQRMFDILFGSFSSVAIKVLILTNCDSDLCFEGQRLVFILKIWLSLVEMLEEGWLKLFWKLLKFYFSTDHDCLIQDKGSIKPWVLFLGSSRLKPVVY